MVIHKQNNIHLTKEQNKKGIIYLPDIPDHNPNDLKTFGNLKYISATNIPLWLYEWMSTYLKIYGRKQKGKYIRECMAYTPKYKKIIRKLLNNELLNEKEKTFLNKVLNEP